MKFLEIGHHSEVMHVGAANTGPTMLWEARGSQWAAVDSGTNRGEIGC